MSWFLLAPLLIFCYMTVLFIIAQYKRDNSIADVGWGIGFIILALSSLIISNNFYGRSIGVTLLVLLWGIRISYYLLMRNYKHGEDPRYRTWRAKWGQYARFKAFVFIFMLQGFLIIVISYPVLLINTSVPVPLRWFDSIGFLLWMSGFLIETIADYQLRQFLGHRRDQEMVMKTGLWRFTRHPNYFGESSMWWGIFLLALPVPFGFTTIISPLLLTYLLLFVSGIPLAEKTFERSIAYQQYKKETNAFFPWFPRAS